MATTPEKDPVLLVGVVSDTHNHLYPEVRELLDGVDHIIHAGDVCTPQLLTELRGIAPLVAVRGNCDMGPWADALPVRAEVELGGLRILVGHVGSRLRAEAAARGTGPGRAEVVIFGHSHQPVVERRDGVLYVNPGSAGPRRYGRPRTMAFLRIEPAAAADGDTRAPDVSADIVVVEG